MNIKDIAKYANKYEWLDSAAAASLERVFRSGAVGKVTDAGRTYAEQLELYNKLGPKLAAKPNSVAAKHQKGMAIDVDAALAGWLSKWGEPFGWYNTVPGEWWHFEYKPALDMYINGLPTLQKEEVRLDDEDDEMKDKLNALYINKLGRTVDVEGFGTWGSHIATGRMTYAQVEKELANSAEGKSFAALTTAKKREKLSKVKL